MARRVVCESGQGIVKKTGVVWIYISYHIIHIKKYIENESNGIIPSDYTINTVAKKVCFDVMCCESWIPTEKTVVECQHLL